MKNNQKMRKLTLLANFLAIAIVLNIIESAVHVIPVPGAKLGLANIVTLIVLYKYSFKDATFLVIARVILVALLSGRLLGPTFYMSLSGATLAVLSMGLLKKMNYFGIIGVSVIGSIFHTVGQIIAGIFVIGSVAVIAFLPVMLFLSVPSGIVIGGISKKFLAITDTQEDSLSQKVTK